VRKISLPVLIRAIACLCFLTACGANKDVFTAGGDAPSLAGCKAWEVKIGPIVNGVTRIEVNWEPFATSNMILLLRRCVQ
jgi:hypothetical protein